MTDTLRERERGHEARYKLSEELRFKAEARRNRLLGLWAADRMGLATEDAASYAKALVALNLERPGTDHVVAKVADDLRGAGVVAVSEAEIIAALERCYADALASLADEYPRALGQDHLQVGG